jgi:hypothetical protein
MRNILIFLGFCLLSGQLLAQYNNSINKMRLGAQTTGDGLVHRTNAIPNWTPSSINNAWLAIDTLTGNAYSYQGGEWRLEVAGDLRTVYPLVINKSGVDIKRGQAVMVDYNQLVQGDLIRILPADGSGAFSTKLTMGIASTDINNNAEGYITWFGYVREVKESDIMQTGITANVGDILYLSPTQAGRLTDIEPTAPANKVTMALVVRKPTANNITLLVRPQLNEDLGELNDVDLTGLLDGQIIVWDSLNNKWIPGTLVGGGSVTSITAGVGLTGGTITTTGTIAADTTLLSTRAYANNRVIGTANRIATFNSSGVMTSNGYTRIDSTLNILSIFGTASTTTGSHNNFIGVNSGLNNTTGQFNNHIGNGAARENTTGSNNNIFGRQAALSNTTGSNNNIFGEFASFYNRTGSHNIAIGYYAGLANRTGSNNIFIGNTAGGNTTNADSLSGSNNIVIGNTSGINIAGAAAGNTIIGNEINLPTGNGSNQLVISNLIFGTGASGTGTTIPTGGRVGIKNNAPARDLHITGEVRITDLVTDNPTRIVGADADGDLNQVIIGKGLSLSNDTLRVASDTLCLIIACSDETSDLTTGTAKVTFRAPYAMTVTAVKANVNTAPAGSTIIVDINEEGTSILGTKLSIDASEKTSVTAASAATITDSTIANDAEMTIDIDQIGSSTAGKGLKVHIYYIKA